MNPILKAAYSQGDWHEQLCQQLWSIAEAKPSAANLKLALDASHCIRGVSTSDIERVNKLIDTRRLTSWTLFFRLCSFDLLGKREDRLEERLNRLPGKRLGFRQRRALAKFPRVLVYLNQHHPHLLDKTLFIKAEKARGLLARNVPIDTLLKQIQNARTDQRFALVGNGPSIEGQAAGAHIDEHDVVIRFNSTGLSSEYDPDLGQNTALWVVSPGLNVDNAAIPSNQCAVTGPEPWSRPSRYWSTLALLPVTSLATFELARWHDLVSLLSAPPSAGILMIDALRQAGIDDRHISTYGFTRLENNTEGEPSVNHYRDNAVRSERHNWTGEARLYQDWVSGQES